MSASSIKKEVGRAVGPAPPHIFVVSGINNNIESRNNNIILKFIKS